MRRDLTIRCVSTGTVRTEGPDGAQCELRDIGLELDSAPAHVRIIETCDGKRCTRDTLVEFDRIAVRQRASVERANASIRVPLDWLVAIAATMEEGASRTVPLWVRTLEPAALLHAAPVAAMLSYRSAQGPDPSEDTPPDATSPWPQLRLVATRS